MSERNGVDAHTEAVLGAVGRFVGNRLAEVEKRLDGLAPGAQRVEALFPAPVVRNEVNPTPVQVTNELTVPAAPPAPVTVSVDLAPLVEAVRAQGAATAAALARLADAFRGQTAALRELAAALDDREPPRVTVAAPEVVLPPRPVPSYRIESLPNGDRRIVPEGV
jgi:hypothetical protein